MPLTASFSLALTAAREAAGDQHYPQAALYVVATPIGNLADITLRALQVLQMADAIACEDTRHTQALLRSYGLARKPCIAVHQHNEQQGAQAVIARLQAGERVVYVSDAGTPAVSDPGARLVSGVRAAGLRVLPLPGASSVTAALSAAGAVARSSAQEGFVFVGFLPPKASERSAAVTALAQEARACVLLEAPHRITALAQALAALGARPVTMAREITKQFEEIATLAADQLPAWLADNAQRQRGEFVIVLHPQDGDGQADDGDRVLQLLLAELPLKTAARLAAEITGAPRKALYARALALKNVPSDEDAQAQAEFPLSPDESPQ